MNKTRLSLLYVVFYLATTGLGLLVAPMEALQMLGSTGHYEPVMTRGVGVFMVALSMIVLQIVRHRVDVLYPTTLGVRAFFLAAFAGLYAQTSDPLFLVILGVVGFGFVLTAIAYLTDRRRTLRATTASSSPKIKR